MLKKLSEYLLSCLAFRGCSSYRIADKTPWRASPKYMAGKNWISFDPAKSFLSLPIVWIVILFFLLVALAAVGAIVLEGNFHFDFSYSGFNRAIEIFRFPLGFIAFSIPTIALLAANHRSRQMMEQIAINQSQNAFKNYYDHREYFVRSVESKTSERGSVSCLELYNAMFPRSRTGDLRVADDFLSRFREHCDLADQVVKNFGSGLPLNQCREKYYEFLKIMKACYGSLELPVTGKTVHLGDGNGPRDLHVLMAHLRSYLTLIYSIICETDPLYSEVESFSFVMAGDFRAIPAFQILDGSNQERFEIPQ